MSEEAEKKEATPEGEAPKKKGGKLPLIIILALVLAGGGFFAMKSKAPKPKPKVEAGTIEPVGEFLVNLAGGGQVYCRTEIAVLLKKGVEKKELEENMPAIKDAIITVLRSTTSNDIRDSAGTALLKQDLCEAVNKVLEANAKKPDKPEASDSKLSDDPKKADKKDAAEEPAKDAKGKHVLKKHEHEWDSDEGPILKIYFTSFATQ
ncbi:MAG: flagellar basal body-associated FliL family protein [Armatimonadetes bacterium]|nr:flagellar basal body-associated FliL family protein [Armatimonadota bacterium]